MRCPVNDTLTHSKFSTDLFSISQHRFAYLHRHTQKCRLFVSPKNVFKPSKYPKNFSPPKQIGTSEYAS